MKKVAILLSLVVLLAVSCKNKEQETTVSNVNFTSCQQIETKNIKLSVIVDIEFTNEGVKITYHDFATACDFTTIEVTHTFVDGVLNITQQGTPNAANCICYTDVSYTIKGISQNEVNTIFINDELVYSLSGNQCDKSVIINKLEYENAPNYPVQIIDLEITNNCLKIKFSASACDGNSWNVELIGMGNYDKSDPPQTTLRLSLDSKELCTAIVTKEVSFDLNPLVEYFQHYGTNKLYLNISGKEILYEY